MTREEFDKKFEEIGSDHILSVADRRLRLERLEQKFTSLDNPDPFHFNAAGEGLTRREWEGLTLPERAEFMAGKASIATV